MIARLCQSHPTLEPQHEKTNCEGERTGAFDSDRTDQAIEPNDESADVAHAEDSQPEPNGSPSDDSDESMAAQEDNNTYSEVSPDHPQVQAREFGTEVALAGSWTREFVFEWFFHISALAISLYLVSLSFTSYYWVDEHQWDHTWYFARLSQQNALKALQFAAKAHETLIIMSLIAIVLHLVRRRLTMSKGLSVGHLVSGYQIETLTLLFRKRLWSPALEKPLQDPGAVLVAIVLFITVLLAKLVGPASAILVLPSLRWWPVSNPYVGITPWLSFNCTEDEVYPLYLPTNRNLSLWSSDSCAESNRSIYCPDAGWDELNAWSGSSALRAAPDNLTMAESIGFYRRALASTLSGPVYLNYGESITTMTAATLQNTGADLYAWLRYFMKYEPANLTQAVIERPYFSSPQTTNGVVTQVQCTSFPESRFSSSQTIKSERLGFFHPIPVFTGNSTSRGGVLDGQPNVDRYKRQLAGCKIHWGLGDLAPSISKAGAGEAIRIGLDWADLLNLDGRVVSTRSGETVNVSCIEALFWRHMYNLPHPSGDGHVWTMFQEQDFLGYVQADNKEWCGYWIESLAARILSLAITDGISRVSDWADWKILNDTETPKGAYLTVNISRYGWGYGLSAVTIFAVCVLLLHAAMVLAYAGYSIYLTVEGKPVTYKMMGDVGEVVIMSLCSRPFPKLSSDHEPPWNKTISVREKDERRLELVACEDASNLPQAGKAYRRVNSGDFWTRPGILRQRR
ncbi:hypothetical protein PG990_002360 [Apiospora arundinis]